MHREYGCTSEYLLTAIWAEAPAPDEESLTFANNGSSVYVPKQGKVRFYIIPGEGEELLSATLDGEDIMPYIEDGVYTATAAGAAVAVLSGGVKDVNLKKATSSI